MGNNLINKDFHSFWRDWKRISQNKSPHVNRIEGANNEPDIASVFKSYFQDIYGNNDSEAHRSFITNSLNDFHSSLIQDGINQSLPSSLPGTT